MTDTRTPVRLEVMPGVFFDEITTLKSCEEILDDLMGSIPSIEAQIENARADRATLDAGWLARANHALRIKKLCLPRLQELRSRLAKLERSRAHEDLTNKQRGVDKLVLRIVQELAPDVAGRAWATARERYPAVFNELEASKSSVGANGEIHRVPMGAA